MAKEKNERKEEARKETERKGNIAVKLRLLPFFRKVMLMGAWGNTASSRAPVIGENQKIRIGMINNGYAEKPVDD